MNNIVSHLDITQIFCEVDDFCESFENSTPIKVYVPCRARAHKVFKGIVNWGKNSVG